MRRPDFRRGRLARPRRGRGIAAELRRRGSLRRLPCRGDARPGGARSTTTPCRRRRRPRCSATSPTPRFTQNGVTSRFYRKGDGFFVETEGPDGQLQEYKIDYTFGVYPLQQYLIAFPGGRWQALSLAWDTRPKEQGGQRWFHLYPDEKIPVGDELHWTGINQNWNWMCADCHSTNLVRGYDLKSDSYHTTWSALNVSCEACHGPGSAHVAWAKDGASCG